MSAAEQPLASDRMYPPPVEDHSVYVSAPGTAIDPRIVKLQQLRSDAHSRAKTWNATSEPARTHVVEERACAAAKILQQVLAISAKKVAREEPASSTWQWVFENNRLLRTALKECSGVARSARKHPHVEDESGLIPRAYAISCAFLEFVGYEFEEWALARYLDAVQEVQQLEMGEIWAIKPMLQLVLLERVARLAKSLLPSLSLALNNSAERAAGLPEFINSLRHIGEASWKELFEEVSVVDHVLRGDPAGCYQRMDYESRDMYRNAIAQLASDSEYNEREVAEAALALVREAEGNTEPNPRVLEKLRHVGYYLLDRGAALLERRIKYRPSLMKRLERTVLQYPSGFYLIGVEVTTFLIVVLVLSRLSSLTPILAGMLLLLLPATQAAVDFMNNLTSYLLPPRRLPKLDFSEGIPNDCATMVAVPALLLNEKQVRQLVDDLEVRFLANRDPNLFFALLSDPPDSPQPVDERDELVSLCKGLIEELNRKYAGSEAGPFFLFHRRRLFNPSENVWMGWERKRGKLLELNKLLRDDADCFPVKAGDVSKLPRIQFVITLDSDTQLPRDTAHRLIGTLAHPLNKAIIDPVTNLVVAGYGILQPRVGVSIHSAARSRLASIYSGQTGFDLYTRAVSDVYQDLFGEGIFAGKGIYEVDVLRAVLENRFPTNTLLSHDLIEGAYARAALVSDIEVIDDYPSHFSAYSRRKHRWVRGDWQITRWLLPRVPDFYGRRILNPITVISRWKILDNLRRSLLDPATFVLMLAGWFYLPGTALYWTLASLTLLLIPVYSQLFFALLRMGGPRLDKLREAAAAFIKGHLSVFLNLVFLVHQTLLSVDAIARAMIRSVITRRKLLEWETAAQAEAGAGRRTPVDLYLSLAPWLALLTGAALALIRPRSLRVAAPILALWFLSKLISLWLNRAARPSKKLAEQNAMFVRRVALRSWRYFREFSNEHTNWLVPDNVRDSPRVTTHRISPTNLGLLLNARQAAVELGYLTVPEFVEATNLTLKTVDRLLRYRGHFFNWYDTGSLQPLEPRFISTVDSGNLVGCLWTLKQGCLFLARRPILSPATWQGIRDHVNLLVELAPALARDFQELFQGLGDNSGAWIPSLLRLQQETEILAEKLAGAANDAAWWARELAVRLRRAGALIETFMPWLLPEYRESLRTIPGAPQIEDALTLSLESLAARLSQLEADPGLQGLRRKLARARTEAEQLIEQLVDIANRAERISQATDFHLLYNPPKKLLAVGYDVNTGELTPSHYDLLATEARMAAFVAIAKGDIPQKSWFHLGRAHVLYRGQRVLLSWTGTIFEYLMPSLWMKTYPNTILSQTMQAAVEIQRRYGRKAGVPWGISEAACSRTDSEGNYQYQAFGIRTLALKQTTAGSLVVSPYSSFLALPFNSQAALANLRAMYKKSWLGAYGFYDSAEFIGENGNTSRPHALASSVRDGTPVRCWMAHHQAMSLMSVTNLLLDSPFQAYFHSEPRVMATELLLHEKVPDTGQVESVSDAQPDQFLLADAVAVPG